MATALRVDFDATSLRALAKGAASGTQARRLLALAAFYEGSSRTHAAAIGSITLQIVRDWVNRLNAEGPEGLIDRKPPGQPSRLNDTHRAALISAIAAGPTWKTHGVVRWRLIDSCQWLKEKFQVEISKPTLSRELRAMGYRKLTARPQHHEQADDAIKTFKKTFLPALMKFQPSRGSIAAT